MFTIFSFERVYRMVTVFSLNVYNVDRMVTVFSFERVVVIVWSPCLVMSALCVVRMVTVLKSDIYSVDRLVTVFSFDRIQCRSYGHRV